MIVNLWHDINPGDEAPKKVNVIVEIPKGSKVKYELDKKTGIICVDRILHGALQYPMNYGFIPQTYCDDKDPLDVLLIGDYPFVPNCLVKARIIGGFNMIDDGEKDDKIFAVHDDDPLYRHIYTVEDLSPFLIKEVKNFFATYKILENKEVSIGETFSLEKALQVTSTAITLYTTGRLQDSIG